MNIPETTSWEPVNTQRQRKGSTIHFNNLGAAPVAIDVY